MHGLPTTIATGNELRLAIFHTPISRIAYGPQKKEGHFGQ